VDPAIVTMQECAEQPKLKKRGVAFSVFFTLKICIFVEVGIWFRSIFA